MHGLYIMTELVCCDKNTLLLIPSLTGRPCKKASIGHLGPRPYYLAELHPSTAVIKIEK